MLPCNLPSGRAPRFPRPPVSGRFNEAREGIFRTAVQGTHPTAIISLFVNFQISSQQNISWKFFNSEANGLCRVLKSHVFDNTRPYSNAFAGKKFGRRLIIESFRAQRVRNHHHAPLLELKRQRAVDRTHQSKLARKCPSPELYGVDRAYDQGLPHRLLTLHSAHRSRSNWAVAPLVDP